MNTAFKAIVLLISLLITPTSVGLLKDGLVSVQPNVCVKDWELSWEFQLLTQALWVLLLPLLFDIQVVPFSNLTPSSTTWVLGLK